MVAVVTGSLPCKEFALAETLTAIPETTIECEGFAEAGEGTMLPLLWTRAPDYNRLGEALRMDPTTKDVDLLAAIDGERLYRMEWIDSIALVMRMFTRNCAAILSAVATNGQWILRILYPDREEIRDTMTCCDEHDVSFEIQSIQELGSERAGRYRLTEKQYEALITAYQQGYFGVPRQVALAEVADEMEISHQALSERLRRTIQMLLENTLIPETR